MGKTKQIFVRGLSRSGGTLVVTLLDAHPEVAMSYELYESLLDPARNRDLDAGPLAKRLFWVQLMPRRLQLMMQSPEIGKFLARVHRGGVSLAEFRRLLAEHVAQGRGFAEVADRFRLIEACAALKMRREGKRHWGLKCSNRFEDYHRAFDNAYFINVIRDGRDVLASQMRTGEFTTSPEKLARSWAQTHRRFREWSRTPGVRGYELFYEKLAREPEGEARSLCGFLGLEYDARMLAFHESDLSIFKAGHLSMQRISSPIDTKMIGRWREDLKPEDAEAFARGAREAMAEFGYRAD